MALVTAAAGIALGLALGSLGAFFATKNERFDRVAEWLFVAFGVLGVPAMITVGGRFAEVGLPATVITVVGVVGAVGTGLGELVLTLRLIDFRRIATLITVAFLGFLVWVGGVSVLILANGVFPAGLGWLGIAAILAGIAIIAVLVGQPGVLTGDREPGRAHMAGLAIVMVAVVAWMVWLGASL